MALYNKNWISDFHVKDIADREDISAQLAALDDEIKAVCIAKGVQAANIPIDDGGLITSAMLKRYATFWLYFTILHDYWGAGGMDSNITEDIYKAKLGYYETRMTQARNDLTADNILEQSLDEASYIRQVPVY